MAPHRLTERETATNSRPWTAAEVRKLRRLMRQRKSHREISAALGRTPNAIAHKIKSLGQRTDWDEVSGQARMRAIIEGELAERADALLADDCLLRMARRHGASPDLIFATMIETLAVLFPDRYGDRMTERPAGLLGQRPAAFGHDRGGLASLVRRIKGGTRP